MKEEQRREERENLSEILHTLTSDMMTEAARAEPGGGGRHQVPVDRWKGMSPEQQSAIHRDREKQCLERQVCEVSVQHETAPGRPSKIMVPSLFDLFRPGMNP